MLAQAPEDLAKLETKSKKSNYRLREKQSEREKSSEGSLRLHYLRKLRQKNKSSRFNEDLDRFESTDLVSRRSKALRS